MAALCSRKDVILTIKGVQFTQNSFPEITEMVTAGEYYYGEDYISVIYMDTDTDSDHRPIHTELRIEKDRVTLTRKGAISTHLLFQEGKRAFSQYVTEAGYLMMGVNVHHIRQRLDQNGGQLELDYALEMNHCVVGENHFSVTIRPATPGTSYDTNA